MFTISQKGKKLKDGSRDEANIMAIKENRELKAQIETL
jgi:hypothetical protein